MSVVSLPRRYGPQAPARVFRRVEYRRRGPAAVVAFPVRSDKSQAYSLYLRGSEVDETNIEEAIELYARAIALDPKLALAYTNLGNCRFRLGRADLARGLYEKALEIDPKQPEANYNLGYLNLEAHNVAAAIPFLEAAVASDPAFADAWFNLGVAHEQRLGTHRSPLIHSCFRRYLKLSGSDGEWTQMALSRLA